MKIEVLSPEETSALPRNTGTRTKYPWDLCKISGGYFVPHSELSREDYRPSCPPRLSKLGWKFRTFTSERNGVKGIAVERTA